ncbi:MAG: hypothetical protein HYU25_04990 [Candidatus Rokubacteria bacterium]|nr:hypothetical protein [Candidatus Rokubacteria bacterium]
MARVEPAVVAVPALLRPADGDHVPVDYRTSTCAGINQGLTPVGEVLRGLELFAEGVMPRFALVQSAH